MADKRKPIKLLTWKRTILLMGVVILVSAFMMYRDYKVKGYFDLIANIPPFAISIVTLAAVGYWATRPEKRS